MFASWLEGFKKNKKGLKAVKSLRAGILSVSLSSDLVKTPQLNTLESIWESQPQSQTQYHSDLILAGT